MATHGHTAVISYIWRYARRNLPWLSAMLLLAIASTVFHLLQPWFYRQAIDVISERTRDPLTYGQAVRYFVIGLACAGAGITTREVAAFMLSTVEMRMMQAMFSDVFGHVQRLSTKFHINTFAGATARKIGRGVDSVETIMDRLWFDIIPAFLFVTILTGILTKLFPIIGLTMFTGIALYCVLSIWLNLILGKLFRDADSQDTRVTANMVDAIAGNSLVSTFARFQYEDERHHEQVSVWRNKVLKSWRYATVFAWIQSIALLAIELSLVLLALNLWFKGTLSGGSVVMMTFYMGLMWGYMRQIGNNIRYYLHGISNCEEMVGLATTNVEIKDRPDARVLRVAEAMIEFRNIHFHYDTAKSPLFTDFGLSIAPREKVALVGHSGSGKSTLTKLILRLYEPTGGSIRIDGQDIAAVTQESLRNSMSLVPQDPILFHRTIAENISYAKPEATYKQIERAAKLAKAHEFIANLPQGYATLVGERGIKLSGGERQRVAIARAILADKPILILDEATSSLDSVSERYIQQALETLLHNRTAIIIAHRLSTVRSCNRIAVLEQGSLIACAPHEELLSTCPYYKEMVDLQSKGMLAT